MRIRPRSQRSPVFLTTLCAEGTLGCGGLTPPSRTADESDPERVELMPRAACSLRPLQGRALSCDPFRGRCPRLPNSSPSGISKGPCPTASARNQNRWRSLACKRGTWKEQVKPPHSEVLSAEAFKVPSAWVFSKVRESSL